MMEHYVRQEFRCIFFDPAGKSKDVDRETILIHLLYNLVFYNTLYSLVREVLGKESVDVGDIDTVLDDYFESHEANCSPDETGILEALKQKLREDISIFYFGRNR
jgi:hypothetical protein